MRFAPRRWLAKKSTPSVRLGIEILEGRRVPAGLSALPDQGVPQFDPVAVQLPKGGNPQPILSYNGGTMLSHVEVQGVYYNDPATLALQGQLDGFLSTLATSEWTTDLLHGFSAGKYTIGAGSFLGDDNSGAVVSQGSLLDDSQIQAMLSGQLSARRLAQPDGNTLYFVFAPAGVEVTAGAYNSATAFLGYHNSFVDSKTGKTLYYAVIPYQGAAPDGATGPDGPNANLGAEVQEFLGGPSEFSELQNITGVASHEFSEAVTDPGVGNNGDLGWLVTNPSSVARGYENGDLANAELATYHGYVVQEEWGRYSSDVIGQATGPEVVPSDADFYVSQVNNPTTGNYNGIFATFIDKDGASEPASDFTVAINWGDGTISRTDDPATGSDISIVNNGDGTFNIVGHHVYTDPAGTTYGTYPYDFNGAQVFVASGDEISWNKPPITLQPNSNPAPPSTDGLSINSVTVTAGDPSNSDAVFTVTLSQAYTHDVTVTYYSQDGTAIEGVNYLAAYGILEFAPGVTSETISVPILDDQRWGEAALNFSVNLYQPSGATIGVGQGIATILPNDPPLNFLGSFSGTPSANDWYTSGGVMTLAGNPTGSTLTYSLDGGPSQTYVAPFAITTEGPHTVVATDTDASNNQFTRSFDVNIDSIAPTLSTSYSGTQGNGGWYISAVTATLTGADAGSGIACFYCSVDGGPMSAYSGPFQITGDGPHTICTVVIDFAGNSTIENDTVNIDATRPDLAESFSGVQGNNGWYISSGLESLSASDVSGVASISYSLDGGPAKVYTGAFPIAGDGSHNIVAIVTDVAGNVGTKTLTLNLDAAPPTLAASFSGNVGTNGWFTGGGTETLNVAPSVSGIVAIMYKLDAGSATAYSGPIAIETDGVHNLVATVIDSAGHVVSQSWTIKIDSASPKVTLNPVAALSTNPKPTFTGTRGNAVNDSATVTLKIYSGTTASGNPVQVKSIAVVGTAWSLAATALPDGVYTAQVEQFDQAGNKAISNPRTFVVKTATAVAITSYAGTINAANQTAVFISGTAEAGDAIVLIVSDGSKTNTIATKATGGHWSFAGLNLSSLQDRTITYKVKATDSLGNFATASATATKAAAASNLVFLFPPTDAAVGALLNPVVVQLTDSTGSPVAHAGMIVTLKLLNGKLGGTVSVATDNHGRATFSHLTIASAGSRRLEARATLGLVVRIVDSDLFTIQ